jgi:predicted  nucleic acid-binding Zn-ribbon protein
MSDDAQPQANQPSADWQSLALRELQQQRDALEAEISELSGRRDQLQKEITSSFAGQSDSIARRVKGFQDYLVGALQELAVAAEQMELVVQR